MRTNHELNLVGDRFGRLIVLEKIGKMNGRPWIFYKCKCDCGEERVVRTSSLRIGNTKSCGCLERDLKSTRMKKHGMEGTREYRAWNHMISRCTNPKVPNYKNYGGRGIKVCDRWLDARNFLSDMGTCPVGLTLDRIDVNGNYEPANCRWISNKEQQRNRRDTALNVSLVSRLRAEYAAGGITIVELARSYRINPSTLGQALRGLTWT